MERPVRQETVEGNILTLDGVAINRPVALRALSGLFGKKLPIALEVTDELPEGGLEFWQTGKTIFLVKPSPPIMAGYLLGFFKTAINDILEEEGAVFNSDLRKLELPVAPEIGAADQRIVKRLLQFLTGPNASQITQEVKRGILQKSKEGHPEAIFLRESYSRYLGSIRDGIRRILSSGLSEKDQKIQLGRFLAKRQRAFMRIVELVIKNTYSGILVHEAQHFSDRQAVQQKLKLALLVDALAGCGLLAHYGGSYDAKGVTVGLEKFLHSINSEQAFMLSLGLVSALVAAFGTLKIAESQFLYWTERRAYQKALENYRALTGAISIDRLTLWTPVLGRRTAYKMSRTRPHR